MQQQQPYILYVLRDDSASRGEQRIYVHRGTSVISGMGAATSMRGALSACSDCAYVEQQLRYPAWELYPPDAEPGSDSRRCGVFIFGTITPDQYAIIIVPGIYDTVLKTTEPGAGLDIDLQHPAIAAFVAHLTSGVYCNRFGYTLTHLEAAFLQVRSVYVSTGL